MGFFKKREPKDQKVSQPVNALPPVNVSKLSQQDSPKMLSPTVNKRFSSLPKAGPVTLSTAEFFDRFVKYASDRHLLRTPLPKVITQSHIFHSTVQLLEAARIEQQDISVQNDQFGGTISITPAGLEQVRKFISTLERNKAATNIQRVWRGYAIRKTLLQQNDQDLDYFLDYIQHLSELYHSILTSPAEVFLRLTQGRG